MIGVAAIATYDGGRCKVLVVGRVELLPDPDALQAATESALANSDYAAKSNFRQAVWTRLRAAIPGPLTITTEWFAPSLTETRHA